MACRFSWRSIGRNWRARWRRWGWRRDIDFEQAGVELAAASGRWRWIVTPEETRTLFSEEETASAGTGWRFRFRRCGSARSNWDARFKTLSYLSHAQAWKTAATPEVVSAQRARPCRKRFAGKYFLAAREDSFSRRRTRRAAVAAWCGDSCFNRLSVEQGHFPVAELVQADEVFLTNSMKGIVSVPRIGERVLDPVRVARRLARGV